MLLNNSDRVMGDAAARRLKQDDEEDNGRPEHLVLCLLQKHSSWLPSLAARLLDAMSYTMPWQGLLNPNAVTEPTRRALR